MLVSCCPKPVCCREMEIYRFPSDPVLKKMWELAVRREAFIASPSTVLCSQHFTEDDFDRTGQTVRLRDGAVPSVFKFPPHLQKRPVTPRKTVTSQKAAAPVEVKTEPKPVQPQSLPCEEHLYVAPCSLDKLKDKLAQAYERIEDLERQLRNAKDRERRYLAKLKSLMGEDPVTAKHLRMSL